VINTPNFVESTPCHKTTFLTAAGRMTRHPQGWRRRAGLRICERLCILRVGSEENKKTVDYEATAPPENLARSPNRGEISQPGSVWECGMSRQSRV